MADTGRNIEEEEEYLKLQKQINDSVKDNVKSFKDMGKYTGAILANYKDIAVASAKIKKLESEIAKEIAKGTEEGKKRAALLAQEVENLKKEREQLRSINKEMASIGNLTRGVFQSLLGYLKDAITGYLDFSQKIKDASAEIGLSRNNMWAMQETIQQAGVQMARYGVSVSDAAAAQKAYSDELGRAVLLSQAAYENMAMIGKATGLGMQGMAELTSQMDNFGLGAEQASGVIYDMYAETSKMGLNAGKVIKSFQQNIGLMNRLNFKNGIAGLKKLSQITEKYKLDMNEIAAASEKAFRPEGAIEMSAKLQVLGGSMAGLGDPFQLMYKARNNPEKFAEDIAKAATESAKFNPKTGEFEVSAYEMDRLREAAEATGQSMEKLVGTAKAGAKLRLAKSMLSTKNLTDEEKEALATMSSMGKNGKAQIKIGMETKDLDQLTEDQLKKVLQDKKNAQDAAEQATGISERWTNFLNQLMVAVYPLFERLEKFFTESKIFEKLSAWGTSFAESIKNFLTNFDITKLLDGIKSFISGLWTVIKFIGNYWWAILGAFVTLWLAKQAIAGMVFGRSAGIQMRMQMGKGGGLPGTGGGAPAAPGGAGGAGGAATGQAGANMGGFMKQIGSAAQVLAIAGAMYILAEALLKFNDVEWESLAKGGVALLGFGVALYAINPAIKAMEKNWVAIAAIGALAGAMVLLGFSAMLFNQGGLTGILGMVVGLTALTIAVAVIGGLAESGIGFLGVGLILGLGAAMLMMGAAVLIAGMGISMIVDSLTNMFTLIGGGELLTAALGFLALSGSIITLSAALVVMSASSLLALPGLLMLGSVTSMLTDTATALASSGGSAGITSAVNAINTVDTAKLEALKDLSIALALIGASPTIRFDESLKVDGNITISGSAGGKQDTEWTKDPQFMAELQRLIQEASAKSKNGGRY